MVDGCAGDCGAGVRTDLVGAVYGVLAHRKHLAAFDGNFAATLHGQYLDFDDGCWRVVSQRWRWGCVVDHALSVSGRRISACAAAGASGDACLCRGLCAG